MRMPNEMHDYMGTICALPCLNSGRFDVFEKKSNVGETDEIFFDIVNSVSPEALSKSNYSVEAHILSLSQFVNQWLAYQTLWDTQVSDVAAEVDGDLKGWHKLIVEASAARATLDETSSVSEFGPIHVKYNTVHSQVNLKYDSWQKELQTRFAAVLAERINESHSMISNSKAQLESMSLEGSSTTTREIVIGVTFLQEMTHQLSTYQEGMNEILESEKILKI